MVVLILLGPNQEYLGYRSFEAICQAELFIDRIQPLMIANIERKLPLKERLSLIPDYPDYFPFAGRVQDVELINLKKGEV